MPFINFNKVILLLFIVLAASLQNSAQWIKQNSGTIEPLSDVVMLDSKTAIAVGLGGSIFRTTDAGNTWINKVAIMSFIKSWNSISFFDKSNGIIAGSDGYVLVSTDSGKIWKVKDIGDRRNCLSAIWINDEMFIGTDSGWIYTSIDTGKTWVPEKISDSPIRSLFIYRGPTVDFLHIYALTPNSLFLKLDYPSSPWKEIATFLPGLGSEAFDAESCNGGGPTFIVGVQGDLRAAPTILRGLYTDTTLKNVSANIHREGVFYGVSAPSEDIIYTCGTDGMIFKSSDKGDSWEENSVPIKLKLNAIYFFDNSIGFAVGDSGRVLYTSNGGLTGISENKKYLPDEFLLSQNYPNPFNPKTKIKYTIPNAERSKALHTQLTIYDILGNEIITPVNKEQFPGEYEIEFDGSKLSSGIYFYVLKTGAHLLTKKMCLAK